MPHLIDSTTATTVSLTPTVRAVNVLDLGPTSTGNWGPVINAAYADGVRAFFFPDGEYPFSTQLDFSNSRNVTLEGTNGLNLVGGSLTSLFATMAPARLIWQGSGTTPAIKRSASSGFRMSDLGLYYDNSAGNFTGRLIWGDSFPSEGLFERCDIGSYQHAFTTAFDLISLDNSVCDTVRQCLIGGGQWGIMGAETNVSNANRILDNMFHSCTSAHLCNIFEQWSIRDNTFEMASFGAVATPAVMDDTYAAGTAIEFDFTDNWVGDTTLTAPLFRQSTNCYWRPATFSGNHITGSAAGGPIFNLLGGGVINIERNRMNLADNSGPLIDLGNTGAGAIAKEAVNITGNYFACNTEAVTHRTGHFNVNIHSNEYASFAHDLRTVTGHERLGYFDVGTEPRPTIAKEAALGGAGSSVGITGLDQAGKVVLTPGAGATGGKQATITLGTTFAPYPGSVDTLLVLLTPLNESGTGAAGVTAGAYASYVPGTASTWAIYTVNAPVGQVTYGYRVLGI